MLRTTSGDPFPFPLSKSATFLFLSIAILAVLLYQYDLQSVERQAEIRIAQIKKTSGVNIHYRYDHDLFFPKQVFRNAKGSGISVHHASSILPVIEKFLGKYPSEVIKKNLSDIYVVRYLEFHGKSYGGTYQKSAIYASTKNLSYSNSFLLSILHAEFSSILFHNYSFPGKAWESINNPDWKYIGNGFHMLGNDDIFDQTKELLENGFLIRFSQSDLENDFNQIIDWAFTKPDRLRALAFKYERIKKKYKLAIEFYKSIDTEIDIPTF